MSRRALIASWIVLGIVAGSGIFDWWMYRATQDYLIQALQFEQGRAAEPDLAMQMANARAGGLLRAVFWGGLLAAAGWLTIRWSARKGV